MPEIKVASQAELLEIKNLIGTPNLRPSETKFNADGSITETFEGGSLSAVFNSDGSVTETLTKDGQVISLKTISNANGSISRMLV